jgi:hypothetical protein
MAVDVEHPATRRLDPRKLVRPVRLPEFPTK